MRWQLSPADSKHQLDHRPVPARPATGKRCAVEPTPGRAATGHPNDTLLRWHQRPVSTWPSIAGLWVAVASSPAGSATASAIGARQSAGLGPVGL